jgi:hypothetical protein
MWKKKTYGKGNTRRLAAIESAGLEGTEEIRRGELGATILEEEENEQGFLIPDSPPPFSDRTGESQSCTTITIGSPPVRRIPPSVSPNLSSPLPRLPSPPGLLPSTVPPRLEQEQEESWEKRKRVHTETYKFGRE